jgi:hypothetical protein
MYVIERSVPIPHVDRAVYPFGQMALHDSFVLTVPPETPADKFKETLTDLANKCRNAAYQFSKKQNAKLSPGELPYHFMLRAVTIETGMADPVTGEPVKQRAYRCWRIEQPERPEKTSAEPANEPAVEQSAA